MEDGKNQEPTEAEVEDPQVNTDRVKLAEDESPRVDTAGSGFAIVKNKKFLLVLLSLLVVGAAGVYTIISSSPENEPTTITEQVQVQEKKEDTPSDSEGRADEPAIDIISLDKIIYFHTSGYEDPGDIYSRPANGGGRVKIESFAAGVRPSNSFTYTSVTSNPSNLIAYVAFENDKSAIYISKDGAVASKVYENTLEIQAPVVSYDGTKIIFGEWGQIAEGGEYIIRTRTMNIDGSGLKDVDSESAFNVGALSEDGNTATTTYIGGGRGGPFANPLFYSFVGDPVGTPLGELDHVRRASYDVNSDFSKAFYGQSTVLEEGGCHGPCTGSPYDLILRDTKTGDTQLLKTLSKPTNKFLDSDATWRTLDVGFSKTVDGEIPYYVDENKVVQITSKGVEKTLYESGEGNVSNVLYSSGKELLVKVTSRDGVDITIYHIDHQDNTVSKVMETTSNTRILGLTFK